VPQLTTEALEHLQAALLAAETPETESEISLVDVFTTLLQHKRLILSVALAAGLISAVIVFLLPPWYTAEATILPPQQQQSSLAALASGALGGLAASGMASSLGIKNPADVYIGILESRTLTDGLISEFHLQAVYSKKLLSETRKELAKHASFSSGKDSLIRISVEDHDPKRAAALANAYVDGLYKQNSRLALTDASQRRLFFEQQLAKEKDALASAEIALKNTEQSTGLLAPTGQAEALIRAAAQLRAQIASREVQLQAMRTFATDENPQVQMLQQEIKGFHAQLTKVDAKSSSDSSFDLSASKLPEASLEYIRKLRDLKYHETLYELLAKQYEAARIDEAKQAPVIQVVDRAVVPDRKSWPPRSVLVGISALLGFILAAIGVLSAQHVKKVLVDFNTGKPKHLRNSAFEQQAQ
jgi:tyrosine-protein kinase Etk/Wzc